MSERIDTIAGAGLEGLFVWLFNESEFLSPHRLRALSAYHRDYPYELDVEGIRASIDREPVESTAATFGGSVGDGIRGVDRQARP
jgi:hypothetical protein